MEAQTLYIKVTLLSLKPASNLSTRRIQEINTGIGELRQLLSCAVCCKLLNDPYKPKGRRCGHHVCRLCLRGRKNLWPICPQCKDCSDFRTYEENKTMALQLLCYKTLCVHLQQSSMYSEFFHLRPYIKSTNNREPKPRIRLPNRPTQWFIQEGANYENISDTFMLQPDLPFLTNNPSSLPAETPPTTAATTPELPYEQHMPNQLSITDIELEAAATGDQAQFAHPLPMMTPGARMLTHTHIAPQPQQMLIPAEQTILPAGYIESPWSEQVDISGAFTMPTDYVNSTPNYTTYVMPNGEVHMASIGQVVQLSQQQQQQLEEVETVEAVEAMETVEPVEPIVPSTSKTTVFMPVNASSSIKRRRGQLLLEDMEDREQLETTKAAAPSGTLMNLRNKKPTIISSVQVKPPISGVGNASPIMTAAVAPMATVLAPIATAPAPIATAPVPIATVPVPIATATAPAPIATIPAQIATAPAPIATIPAQIATVPAPIATVPATKAIVPASIATVPAPPRAAAPAPVIAATKPAVKPAPTAAVVTNPVATAATAAVSGAAPVVEKTPVASATTAALPHTSTPKAPASSAAHKPKPKDSRMSHICRCGTTSAPGKATCRNSRCTCYVAGKSCVDCKCIGCKNPHQDAGDTSDEEDFEMDTETEVAPAEEPISASTGMQSGFTLVPLNNLQQSQHPLVLMQNENGQYQGFNIFNGSEPVDPAQLGFQRVPLRSNDGNASIPEFAYIMPPPTAVEPTTVEPTTVEPTTVEPSTATTATTSQPSPTSTIEQPAKRFKSFRRELDMERNMPRKSSDMLVSAGSTTCNAAAGDSRIGGDNDEEILLTFITIAQPYIHFMFVLTKSSWFNRQLKQSRDPYSIIPPRAVKTTCEGIA
ncbi:E3 ubiquitin-protein ligase msl-2 isoform X2 [Drosophila hydei]|uniref:E3 ubiquitin-protein ligase msl-2 isoform X2 n=1 Tax=Drosophila hydei TaxID=7224 RepID=A0A6J1LBW9_DROHY|nr:E3 ubiquitin-protein ligase msl-2 isoform X2 [Drosophila hydei]